MAGHQTLKELAALNLNQRRLCIIFPTIDVATTFELNSGLIHLLPTFHGLTGEDPHKHLKELYVYHNMGGDEVVVFREIFSSFKGSKHLKGLLPTDRTMIDAASRGALVDKTLKGARILIANMVGNSQQFGTRLNSPSKPINEKDVTANTDVPNDNYIFKPKFSPLSDYKLVPSFLQALPESWKDEPNNELYETFHKCEKLKGCEKVKVGKNVSAVIQRKFPTKCKDPSMFTIPCTICNTRFEKAMLDSEAFINVIPYSIYASLKLGPLNETGVIIQLADKSNAYPKGVVENILVKVNDLVFPADFYILDMRYNDQTALILLGRPLLRTSKVKIDFYSGMLTMEFGDKISEFNIYEAMKHLSDDNLVYSIKFVEFPHINLCDMMSKREGSNSNRNGNDNNVSEDMIQRFERILGDVREKVDRQGEWMVQ
ncbi:uncharacterized protein LOC111386494 [Olea europaea var. sylvestris]|uniref:uncharacterized protein LOC111386494 n=1 Tax=Olea europaea var. sylvestris TaxID=158386 RepID=UPI000C1D63E4|nr:uncharacterized protein LOC111386494 [Olea europaea var. sylvestris]